MRTFTKSRIVALGAALVTLHAHAALTSIDGGIEVYESTENLTWASNANLFATQAAAYNGGATAFVSAIIADSGGVIHDTPNSYDPSGTHTLSGADFISDSAAPSFGYMSWWGAKAWINYLNATSYGGLSQWSLPTTVDSVTSIGYPNGQNGNPRISSSQMARLFYGNLGQVANQSITTTHNSDYALFSNLTGNAYWSDTEVSAAPNAVYNFTTSNGVQGGLGKGGNTQGVDFFPAMAVSFGPLSPVPLPGAAWLMVSAIGGLGAWVRKRKPA